MALKTKRIKNIWDPIETQLKKLQELFEVSEKETPEIKSLKSVILEHFYDFDRKLSRFLSDESADYKDMKCKIISLIEEFGSLDVIVNVDDEQNVISNVLDHFQAALKNLESLECVELKQQLQDTWEYVKEMGEVKGIEDYENIKELGASLLDVIKPLQLYARNLVSILLKEKIILFTCQLSTAFTILVNLVQEQHKLNLPIYNTKTYICNRICQCLKMIIDVIEAPNPTEDEEILEKEEHFVFKMDLALDTVSHMSDQNQQEQVNMCSELWMILEEVLSHTMTIAQVCRPEHFKEITTASKSVISEYENLKTQLISEEPDKTLNNLFINIFTDSLYRLERQVNISMLTLVMEVFSEPFNALKKLVQLCGNSLPPDARRKSDLADAIEDFDQIVDKTMQIGLYAIACCNDVNKIGKIRNHMASLESLDLELVISITSFYLDPLNEEFRTGVKILTSQWQNEMNKLHKAIDSIIDSAAYCQVILDDLQEQHNAISNCFENRQDITMSQVKLMVYRACTLATQITVAVDDIGHENVDESTNKIIRELKVATYEAYSCAAKFLLGSKAPAPQQLRVIKRLALLVNVVKKLQPILAVVINKSQCFNDSQKSRFGQRDVLNATQNKTNLTFIRTPYTVKNYKPPVSIQSPNSTPKTPLSMSCLIPYIRRGQEMRSEKSIMYKTPKTQKSKNLQMSMDNMRIKRRNLSCVRQHLFSKDSFVLHKDVDLTVVSLDLSGTLEKISLLSSNSSAVTSNDSPISSVIDKEMDKCGNKAANDANSSTIKNSDTPSAMIDTPERLDDIERLEKKIQKLQNNNS
ncbi:serendipity locus protein alpha [Chelonus insularis]|uniref:serendipity locus protein alpha n=1 Tax=Chelonus insularis TaxID=460826 RepID=UPI00158C2FC9|nr:serendipity locus protein alpha [Chelonus insularis]